MRALFVVMAMTVPLLAQLPPNQDFAPPAPFPPDAATLKTIQAKRAKLHEAAEGLKKAAVPANDLAKIQASIDVAVYLKAVDWIIKHNEWYTKDSGKQTLAVLDAGLARATSAENTPWNKLRGKPIIKGYLSEIDGSIQPYSITFPTGYGTDGKKYLIEIHLHGRDATLTEVKFIASREAAKPSNPDRILIDVYGRGNNGYRWAGENDILVVTMHALALPHRDARMPILRGFSMGGGGTWSVGLHYPQLYSALQPGAGFTLTRGHAGKSFPEMLPDYQERTLCIYDVANCAENLANIPCVAYSGDKDPQIRAARNIETALKDFKLPLKFEHVIAPGLEHKMPPEWKTKVDAKLAEFLPKDGEARPKWHFVTYTTAFSQMPSALYLNDSPFFSYSPRRPKTLAPATVLGLEKQYERAVVDVEYAAGQMIVTTKNVSRIHLASARGDPNSGAGVFYTPVELDGTKFPRAETLEKVDGKWVALNQPLPGLVFNKSKRKGPRLQGPIDDAFRQEFEIVPASGTPWHADVNAKADATRKEFVRVWDKYLRGDIAAHRVANFSRILFGDPGSNPEIAENLPHLPIEWTKDKLTVNGVTYDPKTHYPVMIYPRNYGGIYQGYIVLNTGHSFGEADFKASNVMLYPRLGDWAVMKLAPMKANPHATEVVAAGIFDSSWQFEKK